MHSTARVELTPKSTSAARVRQQRLTVNFSGNNRSCQTSSQRRNHNQTDGVNQINAAAGTTLTLSCVTHDNTTPSCCHGRSWRRRRVLTGATPNVLQLTRVFDCRSSSRRPAHSARRTRSTRRQRDQPPTPAPPSRSARRRVPPDELHRAEWISPRSRRHWRADRYPGGGGTFTGPRRRGQSQRRPVGIARRHRGQPEIRAPGRARHDR